MDTLTLKDLNNPRGIRSIFHGRRQVWICADDDTAFQEMPGSWELWQVMGNGLLLCVQRWLKKSIVAVDTNE